MNLSNEQILSIDLHFAVVRDFHMEHYPFEQKDIVLQEIFEVTRSLDFERDYVNQYHLNAEYIREADSRTIHPIGDWYLLGNMKEDCVKFSIVIKIDIGKAEISY